MSTLEEITKEKQRVGKALARVDEQREKLTGRHCQVKQGWYPPTVGGLSREERPEELFPDLGRDAGAVVADADFDRIAEIARRQTTGSYYTPDSLVQALLDSALDPVLARQTQAVENSVRLSEPLRLNRTVGTGTVRLIIPGPATAPKRRG
jgi:hypothetical protein